MDVATVTEAAGTALVGAMATDLWGKAVDGVTALWRRAYPDRAETVAAELEQTRRQVLAARQSNDERALQDLRTGWQLRLAQFLDLEDHKLAEELVAELHRLVEEELKSAASLSEHNCANKVEMKVVALGTSRVNQVAGNQYNYKD
ncbi:hypothetical protein ACFP3U_36660 [Kitasatospora misakiensis]|uniref:Uncharacterized protein n=1 Tax=Kitasatospora misakiensis TaxID=67330 RepID=A0ABW0XFB3_9ACTN